MLTFNLFQILTQNAVLYTDMIYKRHQEDIAKASNSVSGDNSETLGAKDEAESPLSLLATLDELDQVTKSASFPILRHL